MKFLHTADWQIGMKAVHVGTAAEKVREERLTAAKRVMTIANEQAVDFVLVAGDTFEDNGVDRLLVQKVADILAISQAPVFIISGNHDPLVPGSVWEHAAWKSKLHIQVLREAKPLAIPGGVLYPSPLFEKYSTRNPLKWIDARAEKAISIGLAHGTLQGIGIDQADYPIAQQAAEETGLDYIALGHWHSYLPMPSSDGIIRLAYSGSHETTKFGERDSGNVLLVEIAARGAKPNITSIRTGGLQWEQWPYELRADGELASICTRIEQLPAPASTLLELTFTGLFSPREAAELTRIEELLAARLCYGRMDRAALMPSPDDDSWIAELPVGVLRETAQRIRQQATGEKREVASRALLELYRLAREMH